MGRKSRKWPCGQPHRELNLGGLPHTESGPGGTSYQVRRARPAQKTYTCPGCLQPIGVGQESIVAWPEADETRFGVPAGVEARRH